MPIITVIFNGLKFLKFSSVTTDNSVNYGIGSYAKAVQSDMSTVGAGVATLSHKGSVQAIDRGALTMGAKSMSEVIGYGSEVNLHDAMIAGERSGQLSAAKDNWTGEHMTHADAVTLGENSAASMISQAHGLQEAGLFDKDTGHLTKEGENYIKGLEKKAAKGAAATAQFGKEVTLEGAIRSGEIAGIKEAWFDNDMKQLSDADARKLGRYSAFKMKAEAQGISNSKIYSEDGTEILPPTDIH